MVSKNAIAQLVLLSGLHSSQARLQLRNNGTSDPLSTCQVFSNAYPNITLFSDNTQYTTLNEIYFSASEWLGPACIFSPASAEQMAFGVKTLVASGVPFAVQGGGHMPIAGSANINSSGILLSSAGLTNLDLSDDNSTVAVGPGNHWVSVYDYLEPSGKTVVGGRMGVVGIPGFLLGGGISFFGNEYGWASANIASFEVVLADGSIVTATIDNEYSDLFWSLRGGSGNFGIVTSFELKTVDAPVVTVGSVYYSGTDLRAQYLQAVYDFAHGGILDQKAAVTPTVSWSPSTYGDSDLHYSAMVFYGTNNTNPAALTNFTNVANSSSALPIASTTFQPRSMSAWAAEVDTDFYEETKGTIFRFYVVSILADLNAMETIFDTFFAEAEARLANVTGIIATAAMMPFAESFFVNGRGEDPLGDPFGINATAAPYIWMEQAFEYDLASDTEYINTVITEINAAIDAVLDESLRSPFLYLNDADADQPVFEGYAPENFAKLKEIMIKYDPTGVFTTQVPGGFKIAAV